MFFLDCDFLHKCKHAKSIIHDLKVTLFADDVIL